MFNIPWVRGPGVETNLQSPRSEQKSWKQKAIPEIEKRESTLAFAGCNRIASLVPEKLKLVILVLPVKAN